MLVMKNILYILIILAVLFAVFNFYRKNTFKDSAGGCKVITWWMNHKPR
jgi:hypothetical protein